MFRAKTLPPTSKHSPTAYDRHKSRMAKASRKKAAELREIADDCPKPKNPRRRNSCLKSFEKFCKTYFPRIFCRNWSPDHIRVIESIETAVTTGGLFAMAMPRGNGKSRLCEAAALWAVLRGTCKYVVIVGASKEAAAGMLKTIKTYLETNAELYADFPEVCHPIRKLEGINQRKLLYHGEPIRMQFTAEFIVLPSLPNSAAAGNVIAAVGITGHIRGRAFTRHDGTNVRPSLVILDDPQTDESAASPAQTQARERMITGTILGMAGPGESIAAVMPCTVIQENDLADRMLDNETRPEWQGIRTPLVYEWPTHPEAAELWDRYLEIRRDALRRKLGPKPQNDFYAANREKMDAGAIVGWPERFKANELSALQHAYNLKADSPDTFDAEYQNFPKRSAALENALTAAEVMEKSTGDKPGEPPNWAHWITCGIDVQGTVLYWLVAAWGSDFTGRILTYGSYPRQTTQYWTLKNVRKKLADLHPGPFETNLAGGLQALGTQLAGSRWTRPDGTDLPLARTLIDANWDESSDVVYRFTVTPVGRQIAALPSIGKYVGAKTRPMSEWAIKEGDASGPGWRLPAKAAGRMNRCFMFDTNFWKTTLVSRWRLPAAALGGMSLSGNPDDHRMIADHLSAEYPVVWTAKNRTVTEWSLKPGGPDNHWLDCLAESAAAAAMCGAKLDATTNDSTARKKRRRGFKYS